MKRASYRHAVEWIAYNDDLGSPDSLDLERVSGYISVCIVADLFGVEAEKVVRDVIRKREKDNLASEVE